MHRDRRLAIRRFALQLYQPESGGWRTVLTANTLEELETSARVLGWQTGKLLRLLDPEGNVLREIQPQPKAAV
jgi:hypothetical protein